MDIFKAILEIRPGARFAVNGNSYEGLEWLEPPVYEGGQKRPTREEVLEAAEKLQKEWEDTEYQRLREREYPDFREYLDGVVKGNQAQIQAYIDKCNAVKAKYPKPEGVE